MEQTGDINYRNEDCGLSSFLCFVLTIIFIIFLIRLYIRNQRIEMYKKYQRLKKQHKQNSCGCSSGITEGFSDFTPKNNYSNYIVAAELDKDIISSHNEFANEMKPFFKTDGLQVRSTDYPEIPWVGLRRPNYNIPMSPDLRQVQSIYPNEYKQKETLIF